MTDYSYGLGQWPPQLQPPPAPPPPPAQAHAPPQPYAPYGYQQTSGHNQPPVYGSNPYQATPHYSAQYPPPMLSRQMPPMPHLPHAPQIPPMPAIPPQLSGRASPAVHYAASQAAFDYNSERNALHLSGMTGVPSAPSRSGWGTSPAATFGATAPQPSQPPLPPLPPKKQEIPASGSFQELFQPHLTSTQNDSSYPPSTIQSSYLAASQPGARRGTAQREEGELEEGELSEGEVGGDYEDNEDDYDPTFSGSAFVDDAAEDSATSNPLRAGEDEEDMADVATRRVSLEPAVALYPVEGDVPSRDASVIDPQDDAFYDEDEEEEERNGNADRGGGAPLGDQVPAGSDAADADDEYMEFSDSEQKSPRPTSGGKDKVSKIVAPKIAKTAKKAGKAGKAEKAEKAAAGASTSSVVSVPVNGESKQASATEKAIGSSEKSRPPFASMEEAKKEAQRSILRLLPYGVNFQTFLDEGFDEKMIKTLFTELGLKATPTSTISETAGADTATAATSGIATNTVSTLVEAAENPSPTLTSLPTLSTAPTSPTAPTAPTATDKQPSTESTTAKSKPEERKDRIARLLAMKAAKPTPAPVAPTVSAPAPATKPTPKPLEAATTSAEMAKAEKRRLLQQKLDALKRQQAAKQAQVPVDTPPKNDRPAALSASVPLPASLPAPPAPLSVLVNLQQSATPAASRKRPIAADLNDFSTVVTNPAKRPFGQRRQESTLIIDVSDDSESESDEGEDDVDVVMEDDSPTEEHPARALQDGNRVKRRNDRNGSRDIHSDMAPGAALRHSTMPALTPPTGPAALRAKDNEYARKMQQIEDMKRRIAEAEAKKARGSPTPATDSSTPSESETGAVAGPKTGAAAAAAVGRRVMSEGGVALGASTTAPRKLDVSARLPKRTDSVLSDAGSVSSRESRREQRTRIASQQLPRVEAGLQEKMFKLKLLQDRVQTLQDEIEAGMAEKERLTGEMTELEQDSRESSPQAEQAAAQTETETVMVDAPEATADGHDKQQPHVEAAEAQKVEEVVEVEEGEADEDDGARLRASSHESGESRELLEGSGELDEESEEEEEGDLDLEMQDEAEANEESAEVEDVSPVPSIPSINAPKVVASSDHGLPPPPLQPLQRYEPQPNHHFQPNQPLQQPKQTPAPVDWSLTGTDATHYESPLKYFSSFRFHPQYRAVVEGGLKSLTFSGKIDPDVELCPYELSGQDCPAINPQCPFQHFSSIAMEDDKILVELGRLDDFSGEQKTKFMAGLREVLNRFRDAKVRDFDTIAYEIIAYRRQFLGDASKVVPHLEDVAV